MEKVKWLKGNGIREWCPPCATAMVKTRREASGSPPQASRRKPSNPLYAAVHLPAHAFSPYRDRLKDPVLELVFVSFVRLKSLAGKFRLSL
jgi:hypothetical protein